METEPVSIIRLLLVDDDASLAKYLRILLQRTRTAFDIEAVDNANDALRKLRQGGHDVCLLDYHLGNEDGLDLLRRAHVHALHAPIILLTGDRDDSLECTALEEGAADYLNKADMDPARLEHVISRTIARHRAEEALRASEYRHRSMVHHAPYGIFEASGDGQFRGVNPALMKMLGVESEQAALALDADALYGGAAERRRVFGRLSVPGPSSVETSWTRPDGSSLLIHINAERTPDEGDAITGIVEDVTVRMRLEEQLRQAQKMEAIGHLAGGVAHDFNNLLTTILGYTDLVKEEVSGREQAQSDLDEVSNAARSAAVLTEQLLTFSGKQQLRPEVLSVNTLIDGMRSLLSRALGEDVTLVTRLAAGIPRIAADPVRLQQVLLNLAANARDAMPRGGKFVIETSSQAHDTVASPGTAPPSGDHVVLTVSDTGCGMDQETQARMFEPFFTTRDRATRTGLGLATVYGIVTQTGGRILCESAPGAGTTFSIVLPAARQDEAVSTAPVQDAGGGTGTILIVEDQEAVRRLARRILEKRGYHVLDTGEPDAALQMALDGGIDLVLTDVVMPGMSGPELAARIRSRIPGMRVMFMSGFTGHAAVDETAGAAFIRKPFTPESLALKVQEALEQPAIPSRSVA